MDSIKINKKPDFIFYGNTSPNVYKIRLIFEELTSTGLTYEYRPIDVSKLENYSEDFIKINPNKKIPAIIDNTLDKPHAVFESGSILLYLAQKYKQLIPDQSNVAEYSDVISWLFWQTSNVGPVFGNFTHFYKYSPKVEEYSLQRFHKDLQRLLNILEKRLLESKYIGGKEYSIADIASAGWLLYIKLIPGLYSCTKESHPSIHRWLDLISERDAVKRTLVDIADSFKTFNPNAIRALFTTDPELIKLNGPLGIENVKLQFP